MGPHPDVKVAAPIPTRLFAPISNLGTGRLPMLTNVFQAHTGAHNVLPGTKATYGAIPIPELPPIRGPILGQWFQRFIDRYRANPY